MQEPLPTGTPESGFSLLLAFVVAVVAGDSKYHIETGNITTIISYQWSLVR